MLWNVNTKMVSEGYGISEADFIDSVTGSTESSHLEFAVAGIVGGKRMGNAQLPYDVVAPYRKNKKIEVRNICSSAASFAPSTATGYRRGFEEDKYYAKIEECDSYVFCDLREKLTVPAPLYEIDASEVLEMYERSKAAGFGKKLRANDPVYYMSNSASMTQKRFFERFPYEEYKLVA